MFVTISDFGKKPGRNMVRGFAVHTEEFKPRGGPFGEANECQIILSHEQAEALADWLAQKVYGVRIRKLEQS
jgi:hypothetical protein